jgi:hypothetical protein
MAAFQCHRLSQYCRPDFFPDVLEPLRQDCPVQRTADRGPHLARELLQAIPDEVSAVAAELVSVGALGCLISARAQALRQMALDLHQMAQALRQMALDLHQMAQALNQMAMDLHQSAGALQQMAVDLHQMAVDWTRKLHRLRRQAASQELWCPGRDRERTGLAARQSRRFPKSAAPFSRVFQRADSLNCTCVLPQAGCSESCCLSACCPLSWAESPLAAQNSLHFLQLERTSIRSLYCCRTPTLQERQLVTVLAPEQRRSTMSSADRHWGTGSRDLRPRRSSKFQEQAAGRQRSLVQSWQV